MPPDLSLILLGLESHGFREVGMEPWEPRRFRRLGREDRFLYPETGEIGIEGVGIIPWGSDYHKLLEKCGRILQRTREKYPPKVQGDLALLDADQMLGEIGGSDEGGH